MKKSKKPKRCKVCKKLIREENKSGLCSYHNNLLLNTGRRKNKVSLKN